MEMRRIDVIMSTETLNQLSDTIKDVRMAYKDGGASFFLQVFVGGFAKGLALPNKEAKELSKLLKPFWDKAKGK